MPIIDNFCYSGSLSVFDFDLAILKLNSPLVFDDNVKPVCLPDASFEPKEIDGTVKGVVSGWGSITAGILFSAFISKVSTVGF